eukprot:scaffold7819_cov325-Pinguiococcus_pyrenoidosus.AAC.1
MAGGRSASLPLRWPSLRASLLRQSEALASRYSAWKALMWSGEPPLPLRCHSPAPLGATKKTRSAAAVPLCFRPVLVSLCRSP